MSGENMSWLNRMILVGFTAKRGNAWHYKADEQGTEPNHYTGAIPVGDVLRRLFSWQAAEGQVSASYLTADGVTTITDEGRKAIIRPAGALGEDDTGAILGMFRSGYSIHGYAEWLLNNVSGILGDTLAIGSAGLLRGGAVAWVQVEVPETITTPEGVAFRPNLTATTSLDGTLATTYQRMVTNVVCDNTLAAGLGEQGQRYKVKHTANSGLKIADARTALAMMHSVESDFEAEVKALCEWTISDKQLDKFLSEINPIPEQAGRGRTVAENRQDKYLHLYRVDERAARWRGTAFGVLQMVNTYAHHYSTAHGGKVVERNMLRALSGGVDDMDRSTIATLAKVAKSTMPKTLARV